MLSGRVGARLDVDATGFLASQSLGDFESQVQVRRARFYTQGYLRFGVRTDYHFQFSVEGDDVFLQEAALAWHPNRWGIADVTLGHTTPPMGLDNIESSRAIPFIANERSPGLTDPLPVAGFFSVAEIGVGARAGRRLEGAIGRAAITGICIVTVLAGVERSVSTRVGRSHTGERPVRLRSTLVGG